MYNRIILFSILFLTLALSSCKKTDVIYVSDPDDAFPMDLFTDYLPYKVNDIIYFNRYVINQDNLHYYRASNTINVGGNFYIPAGTHVVFDAPNVNINNGFTCPIGASFEVRQEGCK